MPLREIRRSRTRPAFSTHPETRWEDRHAKPAFSSRGPQGRSEIAEFRKFQTLTGSLVDVNRKICRLRPVDETEQTLLEKKRPKRSSKKSRAT